MKLFPSVTAASLLVAGPAFAQTYILTDLGTPGEVASYATCVNASNVVVGYSLHDGGATTRAWKWRADGGRVELGVFGGAEARALAVNDAGQIAGYATDAAGVAHGFVFTEGGGLADIGAPPGALGVFAQAINALGHVAGYVTTVSNSVPFVWRGAGNWQLLDTLPGADVPATQANGLNDTGQVAGEGSWLFGGSRAFVADTNGAASVLPTLGGETGAAYAINNASLVAGEVESTNGAQQAVLFDHGAIVPLGSLGGDSTAFFVNNLGDVAGSADLSNGVAHAFVWSAATGLEDLNSLIAPTLGWVLHEAHGINESGLVVGNGTFAGQPRAFLLTPRSGPDTQPPVVVATLSTNFVGGSLFSPLYLTLKVWDDIAVEAGTTLQAVRVTGPGGYSALAAYSGRAPYSNAIAHTVAYQIYPPGGTWDGADNGAYTISLEPNRLRDIAGNFAAAAPLATFTVSLATVPRLNPSALPSESFVNVTNSFDFGASSSYPHTNWYAWSVDWDGDGTDDETIAGPAPRTFTHAYTTPGARVVRFAITDVHGLSASTTAVINVKGSIPANYAWLPAPSLPMERTFAAGAVHQRRLYLLGGYPFTTAGEEDFSGPVHYLSPGAGAWLEGAPLAGPVIRLGAGVDARGRLLVFGGAESGEENQLAAIDEGCVYNAVSGPGSGIARKPSAVDNFAYATDGQGRLYSLGGGPGRYSSTGATNQSVAERYDGNANAWTTLPPMPGTRANAAACYDGRGRILVIGGYSQYNTPTKTTFALDVAGGAWSQLADEPSALAGQSAVLGADGLVYVIGGELTSRTVYVFDPVANAWAVGPSLATGRSYAPALLGPEGFIYAIGGGATGVGTATVEKLDTTQAQPALITLSGGAFAVAVGSSFVHQPGALGMPRPTWLLVHGPSGMSVDAASGLVTWTPGVAQLGAHTAIVRAQNTGGLSDAVLTLTVSNTAPPAGDTTPPAKPGDFRPIAVSDTSATFAWNPSTDNVGVEGYRFYTYKSVCSGWRCRTKRSVPVRLADNLTATTFTRAGLTPGYAYKFGVAAFDAAGNESAHAFTNMLTLSPPRIIPGHVSAQSLSFAIVGEPWMWRFSVAGNPLPTLSLVSSPPGMTFSNNAVSWNPVQDPAGTNSFTLRAVNTLTNLEQTFSFRVYPAGTDLVPPSAVTGVRLGTIGADRVEVSWNPATDNYGIAGYWVSATVTYRARYGRSSLRRRLVAREFSPGTGTNFVLTGLEPNTRYGMSVIAVDTAGILGYQFCSYTYGGTCSAVTFTTTPLIVASIAMLPDGNLEFSWTPAEPLYYRVGDYFAYTVVCSATLATNIAPWSPLPGVTWPITNTSIVVPPGDATNAFYRVRADSIVQP